MPASQQAAKDITNIPISDTAKYAPKGIKSHQVLALKLNNPNLTLTQASNILGISEDAIKAHCRRNDTTWTQLASQVEGFRRAEIDLLTLKAAQALENITSEKLEKESALQNSTVYCQLVDKRRLLSDQSTSNIAIADVIETKQDAEARRTEAQAKLSALEAKKRELEAQKLLGTDSAGTAGEQA